MQHQGVKLVTIVCEAALERLIARDLIDEIGAKGYSVADVRGRGARGEQDARWAPSSNVRFEVLCEAERAQRVIDTLFAKYSKNYGMVAWMVDVEVSRGFNF
jgi:nitrogen regulatory protein PII